MPPRVLIVAALEREVAPLARTLNRRREGTPGFPVFENGQLTLVCGGIGSPHALAATRWAIASEKPEVVMSVGFAGALVPDCKVGDMVTPGTVIDESTGEVFSLRVGSGVLVSSTAVASPRGKRELASRYGAQTVDMEAAAVARAAREGGIPFLVVKAISDEVDFCLPPLQQFVSEAGTFQTSKFLAHVVVRPTVWPGVLQLGTHAKKASSQLCNWLENQMRRDFQGILEGVYGKAEL